MFFKQFPIALPYPGGAAGFRCRPWHNRNPNPATERQKIFIQRLCGAVSDDLTVESASSLIDCLSEDSLCLEKARNEYAKEAVADEPSPTDGF
jgi:hypothetical protein